VLNRSIFLNDLFAAKSFSWTSVMMDLERVLPAGVEVTSIDPTISPEHTVTIHLRVSGDRDKVVDLVRNLERSQRFFAPRPANETAQTREQGQVIRVAQVGGPEGVEFEIVSGYNPLPSAKLDDAAAAEPAAKAAAQ
jgi:type IV pilus assembly protein PilN